MGKIGKMTGSPWHIGKVYNTRKGADKSDILKCIKKYPVGCKIVHERFGIGKVVNIGKIEIKVEFTTYGIIAFDIADIMKRKKMKRIG